VDVGVTPLLLLGPPDAGKGTQGAVSAVEGRSDDTTDGARPVDEVTRDILERLARVHATR
jgi:hypothetical protein